LIEKVRLTGKPIPIHWNLKEGTLITEEEFITLKAEGIKFEILV
jgi:hypothetical protein